MKKYVLYGAAAIGELAEKSITSVGDKVIGYLDRRAFELTEYNGFPVYAPDEIPVEISCCEVIVFIAVKNVFEHEKIARKLYDRGYKIVVYKPYKTLIGAGTEEERKLAEIYDNIFAGKEVDEEEVIYYGSNKINNELFDYAKISEKNERITAYIPIEFIYTNNYNAGGMQKWGNIPIAALFTHINFFKSLDGDPLVEPEDYLEEYCVYTAILQGKIKVTDAWKANVIENRTQIYEQMRDAQDLDPLFFIRNAAMATWNQEKGYFNLTSGKHRCTFLAARGAKYIPLNISKNDYKIFSRKSRIEELIKNINVSKINCIIPNPFFYRNIYVEDRGAHDFFMEITREYAHESYREHGKVDFSKYVLFDMSNDYGYTARYFTRMGMKVYRNRQETGSAEKKLNSLFDQKIEYSEIQNVCPQILVTDLCSLDNMELYDFRNIDEIILRGVEQGEVNRIKKKYNIFDIKLINQRTVGLKKIGNYRLKRFFRRG